MCVCEEHAPETKRNHEKQKHAYLSLEKAHQVPRVAGSVLLEYVHGR